MNLTQRTLEGIEELRAQMADKFDVAAIIRPYGRAGRYHMMTVFQSVVMHSTHDTLDDAKDAYMLDYELGKEARWDTGMDAAAEAQATRYWEEGGSAFQMQYQAELDAEAQHLGWDPMAGAFGPEYN